MKIEIEVDEQRNLVDVTVDPPLSRYNLVSFLAMLAEDMSHDCDEDPLMHDQHQTMQ